LLFTDASGLLANQCDGKKAFQDPHSGRISTGITCDGGGGGSAYFGGPSFADYLFLLNLQFQQRGTGSGRVEQPGGGRVERAEARSRPRPQVRPRQPSPRLRHRNRRPGRSLRRRPAPCKAGRGYLETIILRRLTSGALGMAGL
jgi:hypothetical protein